MANSEFKDSPDVEKKNQSRKEVAAAEGKVSEGIKLLKSYVNEKLKNGEITYDAQGIASVELTAEELKKIEMEKGVKINELFPNGLKQGIIIHIFRDKPSFIQHPPINYMIQQKVKSLCDAAIKTYGLDEKKVNAINQEINQSIETELKNIILSGATGEGLSKKINELMKQKTGEALQMLYKLHRQDQPPEVTISSETDFRSSEVFDTLFAEKIIKASSYMRSNSRDILTFNEITKHFSYDENATVTAHDRKAGKKCANLSLVFEGSYPAADRTEEKRAAAEPTFKVTSVITKHASLPPLGSMSRLTTESNIDHLVDTYMHMQEVVGAMARLRQHGRGESKEPMTLDWAYQLLTTNAFNMDLQATSYGYVVQAMQLMNQATFEVDNVPVTVNAGVFNAGINSLGEYNFCRKKDTQRVENRKAYIQATDALSKLEFKSHLDLEGETPSLRAFKSDYENLQKLLPPKDKERNEYDAALVELKKNNDKFPALVEKYSALKATIKDLTEEYKSNPTSRVIEKKLNDAKKQLKGVKSEITRVKDEAQRINQNLRAITYKMEQQRKAHWDKNKIHIRQSIDNLIHNPEIKKLEAELNSSDKIISGKAADQLNVIAALVYKARMDDLYYSGKYREPKNAAIFNGYFMAYQRLTGMSASTGCKSANDRTYIARLFIASISDPLILTKSPESVLSVPPRLHDDPVEYKTLMETVSSNAMSNSAMFSCINDTAGGTPKVDKDKFKYLSGINNVAAIKKFGKWAAHKMKGILSEIYEALFRTKKSTSDIHAKLGIQPSPHRLDQATAPSSSQEPSATPSSPPPPTSAPKPKGSP